MTSDTRVVALRQPDEVDDPLTAVLRDGARRLLAQAVEAEAEGFLAEMRGLRLPDGRERLVRHGHGPERLMQTGIGPVPVRRVKLRDRGASAEAERIRFPSALLPRWARRTRSLDAVLPVLYLRGVSMGDFQEALAGPLGPDAPNLSPAVIGRLRDDCAALAGLRVTGQTPASAASSSAVWKRSRTSPSSARIWAAQTRPARGNDMMILPSGRSAMACSMRAVSSASRAPRVSSRDTSTPTRSPFARISAPRAWPWGVVVRRSSSSAGLRRPQ